MPVRIDHAERRSLLAQAVWRIALRDGLREASVRGVAREAELSMGSVRYFFSTQDELRRFAMRELIDKIGRRITAGAELRLADAHEGRVVEAALALLLELLPLDEERGTEARIYQAFVAEAANDSVIAEIRQDADDGIRQQCRHTLDSLVEFGCMAASREVESETERLHALLDGFAAHLLARPERTSPARVEGLLRIHLHDLCVPVRCPGDDPSS
ncbi:TetR/AcrR family transcriptional regulator [Actinopolyspora lacussalsi]|uniref:TetR/AcrR family transcriptional regulator n=1 Tax=Actinopolyspora righensis TaxID=995060 RepID=UPI0015871C1E|nr:TetR family transcriptional regulator C-terminal domain-containing protein [Actinopolyspora righensis]